MQRCEFVRRHPGMDTKKLNPDHLTMLVKVENDPRPHLFGIDNGALIKSEIQSITCIIYFQSQVKSLNRRSKKTVIARGGCADIFTTTRNQRSPCSAILHK